MNYESDQEEPIGLPLVRASPAADADPGLTIKYLSQIRQRALKRGEKPVMQAAQNTIDMLLANFKLLEYTDQLFKVEGGSKNIRLHPAAPAVAAASGSSHAPEIKLYYPQMPLRVERYPHRPKHTTIDPFPCMVARTVKKDEMRANPVAMKAMMTEYNKLDGLAWETDKVREWKDVKAEADKRGVEVHVAMVFGICVEKGSELQPGDPNRKFKGRFVLQGNEIRTQNHDYAVFNELGSNPATLEASKITDLWGSAPGHTSQQTDARQAYVQSEARGEVVTWVRLPHEWRPKGWIGKFKDPVVPMRRSLYGHPQSGGWWELHSEEQIQAAGFIKIEGWGSLYWHPRLKLLLMVYVDDFKLSGPKANMAEGWTLLRKGIDTEEPTPVGRCLGCNHITYQEKVVEEGSSHAPLRPNGVRMG